MKLNNLDKASKMYRAIQDLDAEIIKIERRIEELVNGNFEVNVRLSFKNLDPKSEKAKFDSDGSLITDESRTSGFGLIFSFSNISTKPEESKDQYEIKVDEKTAMYMLASLLQVKNEQRKELIQQIRELGFS